MFDVVNNMTRWEPEDLVKTKLYGHKSRHKPTIKFLSIKLIGFLKPQKNKPQLIFVTTF